MKTIYINTGFTFLIAGILWMMYLVFNILNAKAHLNASMMEVLVGNQEFIQWPLLLGLTLVFAGLYLVLREKKQV